MEDSNRLLKKPAMMNSKETNPKDKLNTSQKVSVSPQPYQTQRQQSFPQSTSGSLMPSSADPRRPRFQEPTNGTVQHTPSGASPSSDSFDALHDDTDKLIVVHEDFKLDPNTIRTEPQKTSAVEGNSKEKDKKTPDADKKGVVAVEKPDLVAIPQTNFAIGLLVMCCFNLPFGLLALYFSLRAAEAYRDGNKVKGASRARTSIVLSLLGIMLTMVVVSSVVLYIAVNKHGKKNYRQASSSALGL